MLHKTVSLLVKSPPFVLWQAFPSFRFPVTHWYAESQPVSHLLGRPFWQLSLMARIEMPVGHRGCIRIPECPLECIMCVTQLNLWPILGVLLIMWLCSFSKQWRASWGQHMTACGKEIRAGRRTPFSSTHLWTLPVAQEIEGGDFILKLCLDKLMKPAFGKSFD